MAKKDNMTVTISPEVKAAVQPLLERDGFSFSMLLELTCRQYTLEGNLPFVPGSNGIALIYKKALHEAMDEIESLKGNDPDGNMR